MYACVLPFFIYWYRMIVVRSGERSVPLPREEAFCWRIPADHRVAGDRSSCVRCAYVVFRMKELSACGGYLFMEARHPTFSFRPRYPLPPEWEAFCLVKKGRFVVVIRYPDHHYCCVEAVTKMAREEELIASRVSTRNEKHSHFYDADEAQLPSDLDISHFIDDGGAEGRIGVLQGRKSALKHVVGGYVSWCTYLSISSATLGSYSKDLFLLHDLTIERVMRHSIIS